MPIRFIRFAVTAHLSRNRCVAYNLWGMLLHYYIIGATGENKNHMSIQVKKLSEYKSMRLACSRNRSVLIKSGLIG